MNAGCVLPNSCSQNVCDVMSADGLLCVGWPYLVHIMIHDLLSRQSTLSSDHDSASLVEVATRKNQLLSSVSVSFPFVARDQSNQEQEKAGRT